MKRNQALPNRESRQGLSEFGRRTPWWLWATLIVMLGLLPIHSRAQQDSAKPPAAEDPTQSMLGAPQLRPSAEVIERLFGAIVKVDTRVPRDAVSAETLGANRSGTGVFIQNQLVLTIGYLLLEADQVTVTTASGRRIPGSVAGYDHESGFGLVRTALPLEGVPVTLGDSDQLRERQRVLTLGHGEKGVTELLIVSRRSFTGGWEYLLEKPFYTFPPVNNWSGSALLTEDGQLIGVGSLIVNDAAEFQRGLPGNLFVPTNLIKPILSDLIAKGRRSGQVQPWLGVSTEMVRGNLMVTRVTRNGPADQAGLEAGDIVVGVDGEKIATQAEFYRRVWRAGAAGVVVPVRILKSGEVKNVPIQSIDRMDFLRKPSGV